MMKSLCLVGLISLGLVATDTITLDDLTWKNRVLMVFPPEDTESVADFCWEVPDTVLVEFEERDLLYFVFGDSLLSNSLYQFEPGYAGNLRAQYTLGSKKLCWVLIGKDGGSKMRREGELPDWKELLAVIDAMPMRAREMRERGR